jgi:hypothetical protein
MALQVVVTMSVGTDEPIVFVSQQDTAINPAPGDTPAALEAGVAVAAATVDRLAEACAAQVRERLDQWVTALGHDRQ